MGNVQTARLQECCATCPSCLNVAVKRDADPFYIKASSMVCAKSVFETRDNPNGGDIVVEKDHSAENRVLTAGGGEIHESFMRVVPDHLQEREDSMSSCSSKSSSYGDLRPGVVLRNEWLPSKTSTTCETEVAEADELHNSYLHGADVVHSSVTNRDRRAISRGENNSNSSCSHQAAKSDASLASHADQSTVASHPLGAGEATTPSPALFREQDLACDALENPTSRVSSWSVAGEEKRGVAAETGVMSEGSSDNFEGFHEDNTDSQSCDAQALARAMNMKFVFTGDGAEGLSEEGVNWIPQVYVPGPQGAAQQQLEFGEEEFPQVVVASPKRASSLPPLHSPPAPPMTLLLKRKPGDLSN